jgi:hypothetical protein
VKLFLSDATALLSDYLKLKEAYMKNLILSLIVAFAASAAIACPGGGTKTLNLGKQVIGEIEMVRGFVKITDSRSELISISWVPEQTEIALLVCGHKNTLDCDPVEQGLAVGRRMIKLPEAPKSTLLIQVLVNGRVKQFSATNFRVSRGGCGGEVQGTN